MYKNNQYTLQYNQIIEMARKRGFGLKTRYMAKKYLGYVERHHIIPVSLGGNESCENTVWLTAYEHLQCHLLLTEMCENEGHRRKMLLAATRMMNKQDNRREREKLLPLQITEDELLWLAKIRKDAAVAHGEYMSVKHSGENNPFFGKKHTAESNAKRGLWSNKDNPMYDETIVASLSGENHYSRKEEHKGKHAGTKNGRYNSTQYHWENINTGEIKYATRLEMTTMDSSLKSNISGVINGKITNVKGWRVVKD